MPWYKPLSQNGYGYILLPGKAVGGATPRHPWATPRLRAEQAVGQRIAARCRTPSRSSMSKYVKVCESTVDGCEITFETLVK